MTFRLCKLSVRMISVRNVFSVQTLFSLLAASLLVRPLGDEAVGDGMFWRKPEDGGVASPGRSLHLQGRGDFLQTEPASVLQLCVVHV